MTITEEEWFKLKCNEQYGMYVKLERAITAMGFDMDKLQERLESLERKHSELNQSFLDHVPMGECCPHTGR